LRPSRAAAGYATGLVPKPDKFPPKGAAKIIAFSKKPNANPLQLILKIHYGFHYVQIGH
jgi:hypothetical protein